MNRRRIFFVAVIILIAAFFRFWHFTSLPPGLYPDEAMNGNNALEAIKTGSWKVFYPENNGREGLFINIQALSLMAFGGREPWMLRFPSPIIGTLTVLGLFLLLYELALISKLENPFILAAFGSFFLATSFWHINFSRIGFRAISAPFFAVWASYFVLRGFRTSSLGWAVCGGVLLGLGAYSYIAYRILPLVFLPFIGQFQKRKGFYHLLAGIIIASIIVALPLLFYFAKHPGDFLGRTGELSITSSHTPLKDLSRNILFTLGMFNVRGDGNWRHNISGRPELFWPVGILFIFGIIFAIWRRSLFDRFFLLWFLLLSLPVVISNEGIPHALRSILLIPAVFAFAGSGGAFLYIYLSKKLSPLKLHITTVAVCLLLLLEAYHSYFILWGANSNVANAFNKNYVEIGKRITVLPDTIDKYVVVEAKGVLVRGIPMPAQTVMFITDSFLPGDQEAKHIHYLLPKDYENIKSQVLNSPVFIIN